MTAHRTVILVGPGSIRRSCCGTGESVDTEIAGAALNGIDDPVALLFGQPVAVPALWDAALRAAVCAGRNPESMLLIYPSWWSPGRVGVIASAASELTRSVATQPRSVLLAAGVPTAEAPVVVEIAARLVAITTTGTAAEPRIGTPDQVAGAVVRRIVALTRGAWLTRGAAARVLIDVPDGVGGADALASMIADRLRAALPSAVVEFAEAGRFAKAALAAQSAGPAGKVIAATAGGCRRVLRTAMLTVGTAMLIAAVLVVGDWARRPVPPAEETTFLIEGRVALQVPARWPAQRVIGGPGSQRVEVVSPSDPWVVLHVTQSPFAGRDLSAAAESLKRAIEQANSIEPNDVFVDFDPLAVRAGRSAVTYREVRPDRHIDWTVLVDGTVRIAIGCQNRPGDPGDIEVMRTVCEQAVRSVHVLA